MKIASQDNTRPKDEGSNKITNNNKNNKFLVF